MENFLNQIKVNICYDQQLQEITGKTNEEAIISENLQFVHFLNFIFSSYPEIQKKFAPGTIGFMINGRRPEAFGKMQDGDKLEIMAFRQI
jgi:hypothetical protein